MKKVTIYFDGRMIQVDPPILDLFTPGSFQGKGVFETMLALDGQVFDVALHLKRLRGAFKGVKVTAPIIENVVKANGFGVARVRVLAWKEGRDQHVAVMALPYEFPSKKDYKVCVIKTNRAPSSRFAHIKSLDYALFANAYEKARQAGFDEALLLNNKGNIFEASRSNIFWMKEGNLFTPPLSSGCLKGITRSQVIQQAKKVKISFAEKNLSVKELVKADHVFLTNSLIGVMPVNKSSFQQACRIS